MANEPMDSQTTESGLSIPPPTEEEIIAALGQVARGQVSDLAQPPKAPPADEIEDEEP